MLPGNGAREGDVRLALTGVGEDGDEQALAGEQPLAGADQLVHEAAAARAGEPSPKMVSIWTTGSLYIIAPASATALSPGSSSTSTNCISEPRILKSISSGRARRAAAVQRATRGREPAARRPWRSAAIRRTPRATRSRWGWRRPARAPARRPSGRSAGCCSEKYHCAMASLPGDEREDYQTGAGGGAGVPRQTAKVAITKVPGTAVATQPGRRGGGAGATRSRARGAAARRGRRGRRARRRCPRAPPAARRRTPARAWSGSPTRAAISAADGGCSRTPLDERRARPPPRPTPAARASTMRARSSVVEGAVDRAPRAAIASTSSIASRSRDGRRRGTGLRGAAAAAWPPAGGGSGQRPARRWRRRPAPCCLLEVLDRRDGNPEQAHPDGGLGAARQPAPEAAEDHDYRSSVQDPPCHLRSGRHDATAHPDHFRPARQPECARAAEAAGFWLRWRRGR